MARLAGRMRVEAAAGQQDEPQPAEALGHLDADPAAVFLQQPPAVVLGPVVMVVLDQVVGDLQQRGAKPTVAAAAQGAVGTIDAITLVARGRQACAAGDAIGVGVVQDGPEIGGTDQVDARESQEQHLRRAGQERRALLFQPANLLELGPPILVEAVERGAEQRHTTDLAIPPPLLIPCRLWTYVHILLKEVRP